MDKTRIKGISITIGRSCNMNCRLCFQTEKPAPYDFLNYFEKIKKFIRENRRSWITISENFKSDPLSEPGIKEIVDWISSRSHVRKISVITNGMYPLPAFQNPHKVQIGISIDGPKDLHEKNRGVDTYDKVWEFFKKVHDRHSVCYVKVIGAKSILTSPGFSDFYNEVCKYEKARLYILEYTDTQNMPDEIYTLKKVKLKGVILENSKTLYPRICLTPLGTFTCIHPGKPCFSCGCCTDHNKKANKRG